MVGFLAEGDWGALSAFNYGMRAEVEWAQWGELVRIRIVIASIQALFLL